MSWRGAADTSVVAFAVTIATAAALLTTRLHPLIFLAAGGLLGLAGAI